MTVTLKTNGAVLTKTSIFRLRLSEDTWSIRSIGTYRKRLQAVIFFWINSPD